MSEKIIQQLLQGNYIVASKAYQVPVKSVQIAKNLVNEAKGLLREIGLNGKALLVCDVNTHAIAGSKIAKILGMSSINVIIFENGVKADIVNVEKIKSAASLCDYIVAVGSGTINDLCKYASFLLEKPYVVFGTAASMNGYSSANASITINGYKSTLKAHLPLGIFLDLDVLIAAPVRLTRSGLGDSVCRPTAQADWLLSHLILDTFYTDLPFLLQKDIEANLFINSAALIKGDIDIMRLLATILVLSGFGMYLAKGSYPASQGEHMIAHTMEMAFIDQLPPSFHGEQIGVTTLTMAKLQESLISSSEFMVKKNDIDTIGSELTKFFGEKVAKECILEYQQKQLSQERVDSVNAFTKKNLSNIIQKINAVTLPYNLIYKTLTDAGCASSCQDLGWQVSMYEKAINFAKYSRARFTFLDL